MALDKDTVRKVARLARLRVSEAELDVYTPQVGGIIKWVEQLSEVDTDNVEPLASVVDIKLSLREDKLTDGGIQSAVLSNAPETTEGFYVVPKVVE